MSRKAETEDRLVVERVQTGVKVEKRILKVLKGLAEYHDISLGDLLEGIVLHAFEGKTPFGEESLKVTSDLKKVYKLDLTAADSHHLRESGEEMTDEELIGQFENRTLPKEKFNHAAHVRTAWIYLCRYPVLEAIRRFSKALKAYAASLGATGLYHETITWGYIFLIHERMIRVGRDQTWDEFAGVNADLLDWRGGIFRQYYSDEVIASDIAKRVFVLPAITNKVNRDRGDFRDKKSIASLTCLCGENLLAN